MNAYGHISRVVRSAGIGFIQEAGESEELEFHWTALVTGSLDDVGVGQRVEFEKRRDHRDQSRTRAVKVRPVGKESEK